MVDSMRERIGKAIMDELSERSGVLDGIDDEVLAEIREAVAAAGLAELQTPTDGMLNAALVARYPDWGEAQYADEGDARVIDGMRKALSASSRAALEGK